MPGPATRRILIVGMHDSPHVHRWVGMVARPDAVVLIFPSMSAPYALPAGFGYVPLDKVGTDMAPGVYFVDPAGTRTAEDALENERIGYVQWHHTWLTPTVLSTPQRLIACIEAFQPHLVHSMEVQLAGYLCMEAARRMGSALPRWLLSTWGSDFSLFRKLGHEWRLREVCNRIDGYMADCRRDQATARDFGYAGPDLPIIPSSGGMDIDAVSGIAKTPPSARKVIMVKGYHNWAGRNLLGMSALMLAKEKLSGFRVRVIASGPVMTNWAGLMGPAAGLRVEAAPYLNDHRDVLAQLAEARLVVGLSISDGLPTTVLEGMTLGVFPVQSSTSCIKEWVEHGRTAIVVSPHDTREVAAAIVRAATDDELVDRAAEENLRTVKARWDVATNAVRVWEIYDGLRG